jgi:hypothetical protein
MEELMGLEVVERLLVMGINLMLEGWGLGR